MACEIWEQNYSSKRIVLLGIAKKGPAIAELLANSLASVECGVAVECHTISIDKSNPSSESFKLSTDLKPQAGDVVIIVDDVLYTGRTMMHSIVPFVEAGFEKVQMAVLVFRDYLKYPIRPDFVGLALASTTVEHVDVSVNNTLVEAYLN